MTLSDDDTESLRRFLGVSAWTRDSLGPAVAHHLYGSPDPLTQLHRRQNLGAELVKMLEQQLRKEGLS